MLLGDWDKIKGLKRTIIDRKFKHRFLVYLAYIVHAEMGQREFTRDDMSRAFNSARGAAGAKISFDEMIDELIRIAGVILEVEPGRFSFGHMSFQEHLVSEYISQWRVKTIIGYLGNKWWSEVLNFYASLRGDITSIVDACQSDDSLGLHRDQLLRMAALAPYTSDIAIQMIQ